VQKWLFDEIKFINNLKFLYKEKKTAADTTCTLSTRMVDYPIEDILRVGELMENYDE